MRMSRPPNRHLNHVVRFDTPSSKTANNKWLHAPLHTVTDTSEYLKLHAGHFVMVTLSSWLAVFSSLMIGASFGDVSAVLPPNIGIYALLVGLAHVPPLYIAFNLRTWQYYDIRINPYITLFEFVGHQAIGLWACLIELVAQALGAVIASAWVTGILNASPLFKAGVGSDITNTNVGWAFVLEIMAGMFIGYVYFHNWYHSKSLEMPITMAYVVSGMTIIVFPFIGPSTHNPFRFWASCVIEGSCGQDGWWVFVFGPGIGILIGFLLHLLTWKIKKE